MKGSVFLALVLTACAVGCATATRQDSDPGTTHISVSGTSGAVLTGFGVQDGQRFAISNAAPWRLDVPRLSHLELRKADPAEVVIVDLRYERHHPHLQVRKTLTPGVAGIRVDIQDGLIASTF